MGKQTKKVSQKTNLSYLIQKQQNFTNLYNNLTTLETKKCSVFRAFYKIKIYKLSISCRSNQI